MIYNFSEILSAIDLLGSPLYKPAFENLGDMKSKWGELIL